MSHSHSAIRAQHVGGHVAMATVPYFPSWAVPTEARERFQPWACTFHTDDGGPRHFIAFGGQPGMLEAVYAVLGPQILVMHGGLFEILAERVDFEFDLAPLEGARLAATADVLEAFIASPSFAIDCYLVGADPNKAQLNLQMMRAAIRNGHALQL